MLKREYINSLVKKTDLSDAHLITAIVYSNRIKRTDPAFLESISSSDLFLISILVASKFLYDEGEDGALLNSEWAKLGHRKQSTLNSLERKFLKALDWDVFLTNDEYSSFADSINARFALQRGLSNGWFSYSDLTALWLWWKKHNSSTPLSWDILKILLVCSLVYVAGILPLLVTTALLKSAQSGPLDTIATITVCNNSFSQLWHQDGSQNNLSPYSTVMVMSHHSTDVAVHSKCGNSLEEWRCQNSTDSKNSPSSSSTVMIMSIRQGFQRPIS
jgi:hypothetical protein